MKCNEAQTVSDKTQYKESSLWDRVKLGIHLLYCKNCQKYSSDNNHLTQVINKAQIKTLTPEDKEALKGVIEKGNFH
jgi:hypothetical protein